MADILVHRSVLLCILLDGYAIYIGLSTYTFVTCLFGVKDTLNCVAILTEMTKNRSVFQSTREHTNNIGGGGDGGDDGDDDDDDDDNNKGSP